MFFDLIGKLFFRRQPEWERRRNAKIMTGVVAVAVVLGAALVAVLVVLNRHHQ